MTDSINPELLSVYAEEQIKHAEAGDRHQALGILRQFRRSIEMGEVPDLHYLKYISRCFEKITEHEQAPDKALNLKLKGRPKENNMYRDLQMAERVILKRRKGEKREVALLEVAVVMGVSEKTVEAAYDRYKQVAKTTLDLPPVEREAITSEFLKVRKRIKTPKKG